MGDGIFGINRPGTAGDSGWFGAPRPLVGAANGVKATVTTPSAAQVAVANSTPDSLQNLREHLNSVNRELDNKRRKLERINNLGMLDFMREEGIGMTVAERRRNNLFDEVNMLETERDDIISEIDEKRVALNEGDLRSDEIRDGIMEPVRNKLMGMGISKGPVVDVGPEQTEIIYSKTSVSEEDIAMTGERLEEMGFRVSKVEAIEV